MHNEEILTIPPEVSGSRVNKKFKFIVGGVIIVLVIVYLIYTGIQSSSAYYLTIDELYARSDLMGRQVRVSGLVDAATIDYNSKDLILAFDISSETGQHLPVVFNGPMPDQMREGAEAIIEGKFDGSTFNANTLLLKCPSRYEEQGVEEIQVEAVK
jgi:cytochrome c-type biogenesis protein CcmE